MFETALATLANRPFEIAGTMTFIGLFVAAGIALHRVFRRFFVPRWFVWSYLVNGLGAALFVLTIPIRPSDVPSSPLTLYAVGAANVAAMVVIWPLAWFYGSIGALMSPGLSKFVMFIFSPVVGLLIGAAIARHVPSRLKEDPSPAQPEPSVGAPS